MKRCPDPGSPRAIRLWPVTRPSRTGRRPLCRQLVVVVHLFALSCGGRTVPTAAAADWIFMPSYYSHDPQTGERVTQFAATEPVFVEVPADYVRSGYRHTQSRIQAGGSADHLHLTEEWGRAVRPYGEWERPFRPYSVPYDLWAPPYVPGGAPGGYPYPYGESGYGYGYGSGPWPGHGPAAGPGHGRGYGYPDGGYAPGQHDPDDGRASGRGEGRGPDDRGDYRGRRRRETEGYPGRFFGRPTTDDEFFWPRERDAGHGESSLPDKDPGHRRTDAAHE